MTQIFDQMKNLKFSKSFPTVWVLKLVLKINKILEPFIEHYRNSNDFSEMCLFCSKEFKGGYDQVVEFFNHMSQQHQFNVGHPDNMVFINEFIEDLRTRLESLQCLSCIKCFKDRATLKDHMRKKV